MKSAPFVVAALLGAAAAIAQTPPANQGTTDGTKAKPRIVLPADKTAPATKGAADAKAKAAADAKGATKAPGKPEEKPAKIDGMEIPRGAKGFLGIEVKDGMFKLSFYDAKKKPVAADMDRAALRWDAKYKVGEERLVLTPGGDGKSLTAGKTIRPPYNFKLFITLVREAKDGQEAANESYAIDFRQ